MPEVVTVHETTTALLEGPLLRELVTITSPGVDVLLHEPAEAEVLEVGRSGPQGPIGPVGPPGGDEITAIALGALGGHRVALLNAGGSASYADCATLAHMGRVAGVTKGASAAGGDVTIVRSGALSEPSWTWTTGSPVFLGSEGRLTQTPPQGGFLQVIGLALSATELFINPREPIRLTI